MMGISQYLKNTSCLVLDNVEFRNTVFQGYNKNQELYDEDFERNYMIRKSITQYSKAFHQYLNRR